MEPNPKPTPQLGELPIQSTTGLEQGPDAAERQQPSAAEQAPTQPATAPAAPPAQLQASTAQAPNTVPTPAAPVQADTTTALPTGAADGDKIEQHWVDASEQIIETTQDDPAKEDEAEEKLSAQYLKERFGVDTTPKT